MTANSIFTRDVFIREFLVNSLGLGAETANGDAVKTVVHISENTVNKLTKHLL